MYNLTNTWNPWHGCHKCGNGCKYCKVFEHDLYRGINSNRIKINKSQFRLPIQKYRDKTKKLEKYELQYKIPSGTVINVCSTSDFFIEEADVWREEAWQFINERKDCLFIINTRRPERISQCLPTNWLDGWNNVVFNIGVEDNNTAWIRISHIINCDVKHIWINISPMLEYIDIEPYLSGGLIEHVSVCGESYIGFEGLSRLMELSWAKNIRDICDNYSVSFEFSGTGSRLKLLNNQIINIKPWDEKGLADFYGLNNFEHIDNWKASIKEIELQELAENAQRVYNKIVVSMSNES